MPTRDLGIDHDRAVATLLRVLAVEGTTGHEAAIADEIATCLREVGVSADAIRFDDANTRIILPTPCGNLIAQLPGTRPGPRRLFACHMDTVPLCAGAQPIRKGNRIVPAGKTALGGDNRTGVAVLLTLAETLIKNNLPHPPLTLLFTVREESGLHGARNVKKDDLGRPAYGINFDGRSASEVTIGAVGAERWECEITGKAAHAGVAPEKGISAMAVVSLAIADVFKQGYFGKVVKGKYQGTSNVGSVVGPDGGPAGQATNVVTDFVKVYGESRSHDSRFAKTITGVYKAAFTKAGRMVRDASNKSAKVKFSGRLDYAPFRMKETSPVVKLTEEAIRSLGRTPTLRVANGGLDANWFFKNGIPTVTLGAGQNNIHTIEEFVDLEEFAAGCQIAVALAMAEESK